MTKKNKPIIGYTAGVYDLFHIGHLNLLRNAKSMCDKLIVGVKSDEMVAKKKKGGATIPFEERIEIIRNLKCVDVAVPMYELDIIGEAKKVKANIIFVGDDWYESERWESYERELKESNIEIIYFPYTKKISSTILQEKLKKYDI